MKPLLSDLLDPPEAPAMHFVPSPPGLCIIILNRLSIDLQEETRYFHNIADVWEELSMMTKVLFQQESELSDGE